MLHTQMSVSETPRVLPRQGRALQGAPRPRGLLRLSYIIQLYLADMLPRPRAPARGAPGSLRGGRSLATGGSLWRRLAPGGARERRCPCCRAASCHAALATRGDNGLRGGPGPHSAAPASTAARMASPRPRPAAPAVTTARSAMLYLSEMTTRGAQIKATKHAPDSSTPERALTRLLCLGRVAAPGPGAPALPHAPAARVASR